MNGDNTVFDPAGMAFSPDGNLYVSLNGGFASPVGAVIRFGITNTGGTLSYSGTETSVVPASAGVAQPTGLTFGTSSGDTGNLYVATTGFYDPYNSAYDLPSDVVKVTGATGSTPSTNIFVQPESGPETSPLDYASGVVWQNGTLYVVDLAAFTGAGQILTYDSTGAYLSTFVASGDGTNPGDLEGQFPSNAVFDAQGNLLVANLGPTGPTTEQPDTFSGSIYEYSSSGAFVSFPTVSGGLVDSSQFPDTGFDSSTQQTITGIIPSELIYEPASGITVNGTLIPGSSSTPGILTTGDVSFESGSTFSVALNGNAVGTGYGQLDSTGTVNLTGATLNLSLGFTPTLGTQFDIVTDLANPVVGQFSGLAQGATFTKNGQAFKITYTGGASGHTTLS